MRRVILMITVIGVMLLAGCGGKAGIEQKALEQSDIQTDAAYQKFMSLNEEGRLTEDGYYDESFREEGRENDVGAGSVEVYFADNPYLNVIYYMDAQLTNAINGSMYKLNPGDSIYASALSSNPVSTAYSVKEFRIVDWSECEHKEIARTKPDETKLVYTIPADYVGKSIMVLPVGEYPEKNVQLVAYSVDSHGTKTILRQAGEWYLNENVVSDDAATIGTEEAYIVTYDFDEFEYFFVQCEPERFNEFPNEDGKVEFEKTSQNDESQSYEVELCKYLGLEIEFPSSATVTFEGVTENIKKNKTWKNEYLQFGDVISIETTETPIIKGDYQHVEVVHDLGGTKYDMKIVRENSGNAADEIVKVVDVEREFELYLDTVCEYGVCTFELDGKEVSGVVMAKENQKLKVVCKITDSDYTFIREDGSVADKIKNAVSAKKETKTVTITSAMDGETISADSYFKVGVKGK